MKVCRWMFVALFILTSVFAFADVTCATATAVVPNGAVKDFDFAAPSTTNYYVFKVSAGHSYSVQVNQPYDAVNADLNVQVNSEATTCTTAVVSPTVTTAVEPQIPGGGLRESFTAAANGTYSISVQNTNGAQGRYLAVIVSDTTKHNLRWSTFSNFTTQWGFLNTTSQAINVKVVATGFTFCNFTGTLTFTVAPNSEVFRSIAAAGNASNANPDLQTNCPGATTGDSGFAVITNDGAPGALAVDAYFVLGTNIVPSGIAAVRER
jgi:hypothetical protein